MVVVVITMIIVLMIIIIIFNTAVMIREVTVEEPGHRSIRSTGMPAKKRFIFRLNGEEVELDLELSNLIRDDVSVQVTENGVTKLMEIPKHHEEMCGYYQDTKTKSAVMVKCDKLGSTCQPIGTFMLNGRRYRLESTGDLLGATHFVTEIGLDDGDAGMHGDSQQIPGTVINILSP
ncbi:hypothetical protein CHS0354_041050 [Potamilus streckersoni]|uniref:Uncharacterized protein n=1 Tax=Potamilus streckersoni TaxID=2493646 RepID=A0AAE0VTY9_9BIVA|nr:hypothetical protein CHS0354_041050 [Potamilus streckersoni]